MSLSIEVGMQIREHRKRAGITQEDLAVRAGVSVRTISDYERGKISTLSKISETLSACAGDLASPGHSRPPSASPPKLTAETEVSIVTDDDRQFLRDLVEDPRRFGAMCDLLELLEGLPSDGLVRLADALLRLSGSDRA